VIEGFDWNRRRKLLDISVPHTGFIAGEKLMHEIRELMGGDLKFEDLQKPFACVACDLLTGEEAIMTKGPVVEAIHASIAIPLIFQAVHRKGRYLVDGGLVNQVPVNVVKAMGAEYIIAVNVVPIHVQKLRAQMVEREDNETESSPRPSLSSVMMSVFDIANSSRIEANLRGANVVIEPRMTQIGPADFHKAKLSILQGEMAAIDAVLKIKRDLAMA
jgi:NTE family protein